MEILKITNLRKEYGTLVAVNDVNLSVEEGQVWGLIGPNGAGKTTLLRILATLLRPTSGTASILGSDLLNDYLEIRKHIGFLPDFFNLYRDLTVTECLTFFAKAYGVQENEITSRIKEALDSVGLQEIKDNFVQNLSRGMLQRIGVASLMVRSPAVYLLDEPASGLDPKARIQLRETLKKIAREGKTIIISSHILTELSEFCTHIVIMDHGRIVLKGDVAEILRNISGSRKFVITVMADVPCAVDILRQESDATVVDVSGEIIKVQTTKSSEGIADLNSRLVHGGIKIVNFAEEKTNIEDVFMKISGGGPGDGEK